MTKIKYLIVWIITLLLWVIIVNWTVFNLWNWWIVGDVDWNWKTKIWVWTLSPSAKFEVKNDISWSPSVRLTDVVQWPEIQLKYWTTENDIWSLFSSITDGWFFINNSIDSTIFSISSWWNIWINDNSPSWELDVDWTTYLWNLRINWNYWETDDIYLTNENENLWINSNNWDVSIWISSWRKDVLVENPSWNLVVWDIDSLWYKLRVSWGNAAVDAWYSWTTTSDIRLKKNFEKLWKVLDKIMNLDWIKYNTLNEKNSAKKHIWFIAQQIESIFPEIVVTTEEWYKWVDYWRMTAILLEAIKQLNVEKQTEIDLLKEEVKLLKKEIDILKKEIYK